MAKPKFPVTPAVSQLRQAGVDFSEHHYDYLAHGGAPHAARELGLDVHDTVKTLVFADDKKQPLLVLMHGDCEVSAKSVARQLGLKTLAPCTPEAAHKHTGYQTGGKRGFLVGISPRSLRDILQPTPVSAAIDHPKGDTPC